jgi:hypothetical protein
MFDKSNSPLFVAALDAAKAFDRQCLFFFPLTHDGLFYKLMEKSADSIRRILFNYYECSAGIVKLNAEKFDVFDINQGIKQGEVLSPALFNFFINDLIEKC